eukprot:24202-Amphidinium_carterae.1
MAQLSIRMGMVHCRSLACQLKQGCSVPQTLAGGSRPEEGGYLGAPELVNLQAVKGFLQFQAWEREPLCWHDAVTGANSLSSNDQPSPRGVSCTSGLAMHIGALYVAARWLQLAQSNRGHAPGA